MTDGEGACVTLRMMRPEELPDLCRRITAMDPWLRLGVSAESLLAANRADAARRALVADEGGGAAGAAIYCTREGHSALLARKAGPLLTAHYGEGPDAEGRAPASWPVGGYLYSLAVFPETQSRGVGALLLRAAEEAARAEGAAVFYLYVSDFNERAQKFYVREGYEHVGAVPDCMQPGNTELLMVKAL